MIDFAVELMNVSKIFIAKRRGTLEDISAVKEMNLAIRPGEFFTLLGPSGCGKTTTLRLIAGFEMPSSGEVFIQGKVMNKVPPYRRPVNTVFQNYALFPHMTVAGNVAFGLSIKRVPRVEQEKLVAEALELVQLGEMGENKPYQLSGGQQQRVALARALVNKPAVLLLDEPLGALDLKLRKAMQIELKQIQMQVGITFVYVTHDQEEALTMSDRIAVIHKGMIQQCGDPLTLYEKPVNRFVADFIGESNFIKGHVDQVTDETVLIRVGNETVAIGGGDQSPPLGKEVVAAIRPEKMTLIGSDQNIDRALSGKVEQVIYVGADTRYLITLSTGSTIAVRVQNGGGDGAAGYYNQGDLVKIFWSPEDARLLVD